MFNNLTRIVDIVNEEAKRMVDLDTSMIAIHNNFHLLPDKERALEEYISMLKMRKDITEIKQIQKFLTDMSSALNKYIIGFVDNYTHNKRIKSMKKQIDDDMDVETDTVVETIADNIKSEVKIVETLVSETIETLTKKK